MPEVIENQRWYPIVGWTTCLQADDPPAWCTAHEEACPSKDEQKEIVWQVYKGKDYDEEGWLYGETFQDTLGPMTRSSVVRTRVWMGSEAKEQKEDAGVEIGDATLVSASEDAFETSEKNFEWNLLCSASEKEGKDEANDNEADAVAECMISGVESEEKDASKLCESAQNAENINDIVLVVSAEGDTEPSSNEPSGSPGFFGRLSSAALSFPSSAFDLAGSSSKQAVYGTIQSIKEASLFGLEMAQAATVAAVSSETQIMPTRKERKHTTKFLDEEKEPEVLSMLSKRFPDLSPFQRSLVTCCEDGFVNFVSPPEPTESKYCKECNIEFGMTKFRYQCGYCSESFCRDHLSESAIIRAYGHTTPLKVCRNCYCVLMEKINEQLVQWRVERVKDYLRDKLILYYSTATDTAIDKIMRAAEGTLVAARSAPIGAAAKMAVVSADFLRKYGRAGLLGFILRNEFMQSFSTLKGLLGDLDGLGFQDAAIGAYYFMAMNRGDRGAEPEGEKISHYGCEPISDELLSKVLKYAPLALHGIYEFDVLDIQRISRLQGFSLIYAQIQDQDIRHPSFALLGNKESKTALVLIRGSKSVQDALTDIQAYPEEIGLSSTGAPQSEATGGFVDAFAHNGMLKAVMWIKDRIVKSLRVLHLEGYHIVFAGHSLGAGCAALLSLMLQKEFEDLECFANSKGYWRDTALEDLEAFKERAKTIWAPRNREWAKDAANQRKGKLAIQDKLSEQEKAISPVERPTLAEKTAEAASREESISTWTLTRTNLIDQLDKAGEESSEEKALESPPKTRQEEEKMVEELATVLVEDPKELYIPGKVTHIFFYKGIYEAVHVDRKCKELSHIPVQQNMLSDHLGRNYLSALRVVRDARRAKPTLPEWVPFSTKTRCMCCDSPFTWNSTSSSEAQQNRDQHNCRRCGALVCEGCSEKFKSIPEFGINVPVRVCDRCYFEA
ncbi:unnamed protein product [Peronospora belbahrii]|uniref:sn-1-specific diacylglycerol lipase n=1 Tax=Peronospora belbahrii TaxID=622444 RepID=A0ABN8D5J4_9STRA|nr:unnamed protein product [Peronospora belbahrii]